ncbi:hypothetical protein FNY86_02565 [Corynebacterium guaraldiae]|uniref:hypothetical protein n=1 Tax=Corynebacterium guaraldiae TaxID=3051103 RepID=UPI00117857DA|nr:hypothetical protein [Corynebacterium guaraldiae]TRX34656.1 hypothetical protein FNY86_02565 [Corynebacterium guaraldiae]
MTDSDRNHGFGARPQQGNGSQPQSPHQETHPETADFEAPPTQQRPVQPQQYPQNMGSNPNYSQSGERNYSNPFAPSGSQGQYPQQQQFSTQQFPPQAAPQDGFGQYDQQPAAYANSYAQDDAGNHGSSNSGKLVLIGVLILAVILVIAALAYLIFFKHADSGSQAEPPQTPAQLTEQNEGPQDSTSAAEEPEKTSEQSTTTSKAQKRPEHPDLPAGAIPANDAARNNEPGGNFNSVYRGTEVTTEPFANSVRDEYVKHYVDTHEFDAKIKAFSPVTGQSYSMDCSDNGEYVTCTGGNNAVVYIL